MKSYLSRIRQYLLVWVWEKLNTAPLHTDPINWVVEDRRWLKDILSTERGAKLQRALVCEVNYEARQAMWAGREWNCGLAHGCEVMVGKILKLASNVPAAAKTTLKDSANAPQSQGESKPNGEQTPRRLSRTYV